MGNWQGTLRMWVCDREETMKDGSHTLSTHPRCFQPVHAVGNGRSAFVRVLHTISEHRVLKLEAGKMVGSNTRPLRKNGWSRLSLAFPLLSRCCTYYVIESESQQEPRHGSTEDRTLTEQTPCASNGDHDRGEAHQSLTPSRIRENLCL